MNDCTCTFIRAALCVGTLCGGKCDATCRPACEMLDDTAPIPHASYRTASSPPTVYLAANAPVRVTGVCWRPCCRPQLLRLARREVGSSRPSSYTPFRPLLGLVIFCSWTPYSKRAWRLAGLGDSAKFAWWKSLLSQAIAVCLECEKLDEVAHVEARTRHRRR